MASRAKTISTFGGLAAIVLWSSTIAVARSLSERVGPLTAGACVYLIGGLLCLIPWPRRLPTTTLRSLPPLYLWGCGALFVLYTVLLYLAVGLASNREQVLEVGIVNYLWPALTLLLSIPLLRQRAGVLLLPGTFLAMFGVVLVMTQGARLSWSVFAEHLHRDPLAYVLATVAAFSWALYSNLTRRWSAGATGGAAGWFVASTGLMLLLLRLPAAEPGAWSIPALLEAIFLGGITALAYALWDRAMRDGDLLLVAACSYLTPLLSTLVSCLYLKVPVSPKLWLGCLLLTVGSLLSWRSVSSTLSTKERGEKS
jgi:drug/metabolite transporter (DMT)-like permease